LDGSVDIEGSVSYASQDPWIFSGTIKENILFGQDYDETWFNRVVECCCLVKVMFQFAIKFGYNTFSPIKAIYVDLMTCY